VSNKVIRLPLEAIEPYMLPTPPPTPGRECEPPPAPLDWHAIFGNDHPVEIEVGSGKGLFLVNAGMAHPETNYVGIEIVHKYQFSIANRLAKRRLANVRIAYSDARWILRDWVAEASVQAVHLYFPDPWWKLKHRKRRMFTEEFARQSYRILRPGGSLFVVTDVADYAKVVRRTVPHTPFVEREPPPESPGSHQMDYLTNFERRFREEGRPIHRMRFEKTFASQCSVFSVQCSAEEASGTCQRPEGAAVDSLPKLNTEH
jgi:tRNA (guanine-N7-)-methyltransferase